MARTGGSGLERMAGVPLTGNPRTQAFGNTDLVERHLPFHLDRERYPEEFQ